MYFVFRIYGAANTLPEACRLVAVTAGSEELAAAAVADWIASEPTLAGRARARRRPDCDWPHQLAHRHRQDDGACCNCGSGLVRGKSGKHYCESGCGEVLAIACSRARRIPELGSATFRALRGSTPAALHPN